MSNEQSSFTKENGYLIDEFDELRDLRYSDLQFLDEYRELKMRKNDGEPVDQNRLDELELVFKNKIVTSSRWNKFQNALTNMQTFIKDEVEGYIEDKQLDFNDYIDAKESAINTHTTNAKIEVDQYVDDFEDYVNQFDDKGIYNESTSYKKRNFVRYDDGGGEQVYLALKDTTGNPPTEQEFWRLLTIKGDRGERGSDGFNLTYKGQWNSSEVYGEADGVQFGNVVFISNIENNIGNQPDPSTNTGAWDRIIFSSIITTKLRGQRTLASPSSTVNFITGGITSFNRDVDDLEVVVNSTVLEQEVDYVINLEGNRIEKVSGLWDAGSLFYFRVVRNQISELVFSDGQSIQNGTISRDKLQQNAQRIISDTAPTAPVHGQQWVDTSVSGV